MILISRGEPRHPHTLYLTPKTRAALGVFGNDKIMVLSDTVNYLLSLQRLHKQFSLNETHYVAIGEQRKAKKSKTTLFLTEENHHYLIRLTDDSFYKPIHVFDTVIGEALELAKTHSLGLVVKKDEMLSSTH